MKEEVSASVQKSSIDAFAGALDGLRSFDPVRAVQAYGGPKLAIAAGDNPASLHVQVPGLRVVRMEGVSHWLMLDKPGEFNRILDEFLLSLPG